MMKKINPNSLDNFPYRICPKIKASSFNSMHAGYFSCFSCYLLTFQNKFVSKYFLNRNAIRVSNGLDPDQDQ